MASEVPPINEAKAAISVALPVRLRKRLFLNNLTAWKTDC